MDIVEYLQIRGIDYVQEGKNVGSTEVNINCPFCSDPSYHLSINLVDPIFSCWRCRTQGHISKLIYHFEKTNAKTILEKLSYSSARITTRSSIPIEGRQFPSQVKFTFSTQKELLQLHSDWLQARNFNPEYIFNKYRLMCVGPTSIFKYRLIIPIYMQRRLVAYTSRDVTNKAELRYLIAKNEECVIPVKQTLYNYDNAKDTAIVVEGPTDVWRLGDGAVATLGTVFTSQQIFLLGKFTRVFIMYDAKAEEVGEKLAHQASSVVPFVELIEMSEGDPADMSEKEVRSLRRELFGKIA